MKPAKSPGICPFVGAMVRVLSVAVIGPVVLVFCMINFYPLALWISGPWQRVQFEEARQQLDAEVEVGSFDSAER